MLVNEGESTDQHSIHSLLDLRLGQVTPGHEAVVHLQVVVAFRGGVVPLQNLEPCPALIVICGVSLLSTYKRTLIISHKR